MKPISQIKEEIKKAIVKGIEVAFTRLENYLSPQSSKHDVLTQLKGRYAEVQSNYHLGVISQSDSIIIHNEIRYALLMEIVGKLELKDFRNQDQISDEGIYYQKPILPFDLRLPRFKKDVLRIDRKSQFNIFKERYDRIKEFPVQHYFVYADRHQQPRSFVERIIFEMESTPEVIQYDAKGDKHIQVQDIELPSDLEMSKLLFRQYFSQRFGEDISSLRDMTAALGSGEQYDVITTVLKLHVEEWEHYTFDFFKWIFSEFCQTDPALPTKFLFFFIIQKDTLAEKASRMLKRFFGGRSSRQKMAEKTLKEVLQFSNCTVFPELKPISLHDLTKWLEEFISNETAIDKLLLEITGTQKYPKELDLSLVEEQLTKAISP